MKKTSLIIKLTALFLLSGIVFVGCRKEATLPDSSSDAIQGITKSFNENAPSIARYSHSPIKGQYIVVLNSNYTGKSVTAKNVKYKEKKEMLKNEIAGSFSKGKIAKEDIKNIYVAALTGFTAKLTPSQVQALKNDSRVKSIEQDNIITLSPINSYRGKPNKPGGGGGSTTPDPQELPWGITRVGGGNTYTGTATAWIIDTGIDLDHPDLNVDVSRSISFLSGSRANKSPEDQNGHGSHVAGTVAALNNSIGVVGVAPGAIVVAIRVLDKRGSGTTSGVIAGVDWVAANASPGDVANMSLGGGVSAALDNAVIAAAENGIKFSLAAGNESEDANDHSPARAEHANIYTISAMEIGDNWAYFSNYGNPPIDFCAPGMAIRSTWKNGEYNTISGTSMAAPHVCGLLLLGSIVADGVVAGDPDNNPDPIAHN